MLAVVVIAAGKQIRTRQTHKGELRAVGTAANRLHLWIDLAIHHRLTGNLHHVRVRHHFFMHIVIAVFDDQLNIAIRMQPLADLFGDLHHFALAGLKLLAVKIADDVVHIGPIDRAFDAGQMVEALIAFGGFRRFVRWDFGMNARRQRQRVDHHPFRRTGMNIVANDLNRHRRGVKVLELQLTHAATVDGIGPAGVKRGNIEMLRPFAHLFIWGKGHANIAVRNILRL